MDDATTTDGENLAESVHQSEIQNSDVHLCARNVNRGLHNEPQVHQESEHTLENSDGTSRIDSSGDREYNAGDREYNAGDREYNAGDREYNAISTLMVQIQRSISTQPIMSSNNNNSESNNTRSVHSDLLLDMSECTGFSSSPQMRSPYMNPDVSGCTDRGDENYDKLENEYIHERLLSRDRCTSPFIRNDQISFASSHLGQEKSDQQNVALGGVGHSSIRSHPMLSQQIGEPDIWSIDNHTSRYQLNSPDERLYDANLNDLHQLRRLSSSPANSGISSDPLHQVEVGSPFSQSNLTPVSSPVPSPDSTQPQSSAISSSYYNVPMFNKGIHRKREHQSVTSSAESSLAATSLPTGAERTTPNACRKTSVTLNSDGLTYDELLALEMAYHESPYPSYQQLGKRLGITPFKVKCWFRKRRRNLHQESGAECTVEEEQQVFKQFICDHAAGRIHHSASATATSAASGDSGPNPTSAPVTSTDSSTIRGLLRPAPGAATLSTASTGATAPQSTTVTAAIASSAQQTIVTIKQPKIARVRPNPAAKTRSRKRTVDNNSNPTVYYRQHAATSDVTSLDVNQSSNVGATSLNRGHALTTMRQLPQKPLANNDSTLVKTEHYTQQQGASNSTRDQTSPTLSCASKTANPYDYSSVLPVYKTPEIEQLMQEREYLGRLLHEQQMTALETRKKLIDCDRQLARVSARMQTQYPYHSTDTWAHLAVHPQMMMMVTTSPQQMMTSPQLPDVRAATSTATTFVATDGRGQHGQGYHSRGRASNTTTEPDLDSLLAIGNNSSGRQGSESGDEGQH